MASLSDIRGYWHLEREDGAADETTGELQKPHRILQFTPLWCPGISQKATLLYDKGRSLRQISQELQIPKTTLRKNLIEDGVPLRPSYHTPEGKLARKKYKMPSVAPFGFAFLDGRLVVHPKEIHVVRRILTLRNSGRSCCSIADALNDLGVPTREGKLWHGWTISLIVKRNVPTDPKALERIQR